MIQSEIFRVSINPENPKPRKCKYKIYCISFAYQLNAYVTYIFSFVFTLHLLFLLVFLSPFKLFAANIQNLQSIDLHSHFSLSIFLIKRMSASKRKRDASSSSSSSSSSISAASKKIAKAKARKPTKKQEDDLSSVRDLQQKQVETRKKIKTLEELGHTNCIVVEELTPDETMRNIERIICDAALQILSKRGLSYNVPARTSTNQLYVPELDRIVLRAVNTKLNFTSQSSTKKATIFTRVLELCHKVLRTKIHVTKRDLFYTDVNLFEDQKHSDAVLDDIATSVGCTRSSLNVVASDKGVVVGRVQFEEAGDEIDCTKQGVGGKAIPPHIDQVTNIRSDAQFILVVEKDAAFMRLAEDRFYNSYPCIIITGKGQPDVATRLFLSKIRETLNIPVLGLVDADPYGLKILSVYMQGSKNMSYDSRSLTTRDIKWLGIRPTDFAKYNIPEECLIPMTEKDMETGKKMLEEDFIKQNEDWCKEIKMMLKLKKKAEIQALSVYGFQYLTKVYLPQKLKAGDWI